MHCVKSVIKLIIMIIHLIKKNVYNLLLLTYLLGSLPSAGMHSVMNIHVIFWHALTQLPACKHHKPACSHTHNMHTYIYVHIHKTYTHILAHLYKYTHTLINRQGFKDAAHECTLNYAGFLVLCTASCLWNSSFSFLF